MNRRIDLHGANDALPIPQRHAHRGTDAMNGDRFSAQESRVFEGVGRHERDLLLGDHLQNRSRDRDVLRLGAFDEAREFRNRIARSSKRMMRPRSTGRYLKIMSMTVLSSVLR